MGAGLCRLVLARSWGAGLGTGRAVEVTPLGERELHPATWPGRTEVPHLSAEVAAKAASAAGEAFAD